VAGIRTGRTGEPDNGRNHDTGDESDATRPAASDTNNSFHNVSLDPCSDRPIATDMGKITAFSCFYGESDKCHLSSHIANVEGRTT
jgi:hypothetical protein